MWSTCTQCAGSLTHTRACLPVFLCLFVCLCLSLSVLAKWGAFAESHIETRFAPPPALIPQRLSDFSGCVPCAEEVTRMKTGTTIKGAYLLSTRNIEERQKSQGLAVADMSGQVWHLKGVSIRLCRFHGKAVISLGSPGKEA